MERKLRDQVRQRASLSCEYCQMPQSYAEPTHEIDHVIAEQHRGPTTLNNLALACFHCNNHKVPNIAGIDPETTELIRLYHPRLDRWEEHFAWKGPRLVGVTAICRTTVEVLAINIRHRVAHRQALMEEGVFPPR